MKTKVASILIISAFMMYSCDTKKEDVVVVDDRDNVEMEDTLTTNDVVDDHNAQNALDWSGTYKGILPCADCEGIETELELNKDNTFELDRKYLGKATETKDDSKGNFTWVDGNTIKLEGIPEGESSVHYKIEENRIRQLDMSGKEVTGDMAEKYVLLKK